MALQALNSSYLSMGLCKSLSSCYPAALLSSLTCRAELWTHGLEWKLSLPSEQGARVDPHVAGGRGGHEPSPRSPALLLQRRSLVAWTDTGQQESGFGRKIL